VSAALSLFHQGYNTKSLAVMEESVVWLSRTAKSAARAPTVLTWTDHVGTGDVLDTDPAGGRESRR
jgi:hypothetical protein